MKAKLLTIATSAFFVVASNLAASATSYDVSGGWLFPPDSFSGTFDFTGGSPLVDAASITIDRFGVAMPLAVLNDVASSSHVGGPFYSLTVNDGTGLGDYSLTFEFALPTKNIGVAIFATLSKVEEFDVCTGRGTHRTCSEQEEDVILASFGDGSLRDAPSPTPLPAALPLFVGGLGIIGLVAGRRRKRKSAGLGAA
jgi:hypothetical protein